MKEIYSSSITDPSLRELEEFAGWYNEKIGNYPIIVGGWAVYCYTKGLGSKDIDVVFLGDAPKQVTLFAYFASHGYQERRRSFFDKEFVKPVKVGDNEVEIIIDAVSSKRIITFEGRKARLPWDWAVKHSRQYKLGKAVIYIPTVELLLTYKFGAILGRNINLKTGLDFAYYRSKLWKDVYDILTLMQLKVDAGKARRFLTDSGLHEYKDEILQIMEDNLDAEMKSLLPGSSLAKVKLIFEK